MFLFRFCAIQKTANSKFSTTTKGSQRHHLGLFIIVSYLFVQFKMLFALQSMSAPWVEYHWDEHWVFDESYRSPHTLHTSWLFACRKRLCHRHQFRKAIRQNARTQRSSGDHHSESIWRQFGESFVLLYANVLLFKENNIISRLLIDLTISIHSTKLPFRLMNDFLILNKSS